MGIEITSNEHINVTAIGDWVHDMHIRQDETDDATISQGDDFILVERENIDNVIRALQIIRDRTIIV